MAASRSILPDFSSQWRASRTTLAAWGSTKTGMRSRTAVVMKYGRCSIDTRPLRSLCDPLGGFIATKSRLESRSHKKIRDRSTSSHTPALKKMPFPGVDTRKGQGTGQGSSRLNSRPACGPVASTAHFRTRPSPIIPPSIFQARPITSLSGSTSSRRILNSFSVGGSVRSTFLGTIS